MQCIVAFATGTCF